jgi:hypothetical protein
MYNLNWSRKTLSPQKLGTFCEYYAKMALTSYGMSVYTAEVDDHGIDFVAESKDAFLKFQVKSVRENTKYVFMREEYFKAHDSKMNLILILLKDGEHPDMYVIPATAWQTGESKLLVYHSYEGKKSDPEYGVNLSSKTMPELQQFRLDAMIDKLVGTLQ